MWDFIHSVTGDIHQLIDYLSRHPDKVHVLLKTPPPKSEVAEGTDTRAVMQHILFYILDGVLPFLHVSDDNNNPVNMQDPIRIRSGSAGKQRPEADPMILAHRLASGPDLFGQNLTQSARTEPDTGWFCTILSGTSLEERNRV